MKKEIVFILLLAFFTSCLGKTIIPDGPDDDDQEQVEGDDEEEPDPEPEPLPPNIHQFYPDKKGRLNVSSSESAKILPGDIVYLRGRFLNVKFTGLQGSEEKPIRITNYPGEVLIVGEPDWAGGAYNNAIQLQESKYIILGGEDSGSTFRITGSIHPNASGGYIGISLQPFTDNIEVKNISIVNGGVGIISKTDPQLNNPKTWYPNTMLQNLSIHDISISYVKGVAMYIGHTSIYWGWDENGKGYNVGTEPPVNSSHTIVQPLRWKNVKIYNNTVWGSGWDGIQASSIDQLEIYGNEVSNYGVYGMFGQSMGIQVGGNTTNSYIHDNYVHDGGGDAIQFHGSNGDNSSHIISNNLCVNINSSGLGIYGLLDDATVWVLNNTVANCLLSGVTANGRGKKTLVKMDNNLFIACHQKIPLFIHYIKSINEAVIEKTENNLMYYSAEDAKVDSLNLFAPLPGSEVDLEGCQMWR